MIDLRSAIPLVAGLVLITPFVGCNEAPYDFAPVSGVVTLDGEPLVDARVTFMPKRQGNSLVSGPDSVGRTDSEGRFELETITGYSGAIVGKHTVRLSTLKQKVAEDGETFLETSPELVPAHYNSASKLVAEVPSNGGDDFAFELQGHKKGRRK